jgi:hypothetical protein
MAYIPTHTHRYAYTPTHTYIRAHTPAAEDTAAAAAAHIVLVAGGIQGLAAGGTLVPGEPPRMGELCLSGSECVCMYVCMCWGYHGAWEAAPYGGTALVWF